MSGYLEVRKDGFSRLFKGTSAAGNEYEFAKQDVYQHKDDGQIIKKRVVVSKDDFPYAPGRYHVHSDCLTDFTDQKNNDYFRIGGGGLKLVPASSVSAAA